MKLLRNVSGNIVLFFFDREKWFKLNLSQFSFFFNALLYILAVAPEPIVALG